MKKTFVIAAGIIILVFIIVMAIAYPFMLLWNWIIPGIFGVGKLTFWKTVGLLILLSMIGSFFKKSSSSK